jgi:hypothetical protein
MLLGEVSMMRRVADADFMEFRMQDSECRPSRFTILSDSESEFSQ